jgi:hypothetical protein
VRHLHRFLIALAVVLLLSQLANIASAATIDTISFSGRTWDVSAYENFSNDASQVWVDANGSLHLKLSQATGTWKDVEVVTQQTLGYGNYTWVTQGVHAIDKNIVLGMFPYLDNDHEIDIEQAQWDNANAPNFDFWVQPGNDNARVFNVSYTSSDTTFVIDWEPTYIHFSITEGSTLVQSWTCDQARDATGVFGIMNLWQFSGAPSDGQPVEIVFKSFQYQAYTETNNTQDNGSGNDTTDPPASDSNDTNTTAGFTTADYWVLHWYYIVGFFGVCFAMIGGFTRHWLVMLLGVVVIVFCYLYATSGGVLIGWLTGTGL